MVLKLQRIALKFRPFRGRSSRWRLGHNQKGSGNNEINCSVLHYSGDFRQEKIGRICVSARGVGLMG